MKLAEGVSMVEYDVYGLPKTEEIAKLKRELNIEDAVLESEGQEGSVIAPPPNVFRSGYHWDTDIEEEKMDADTKEVDDLFDDAEEITQDEKNTEVIDETFILSLNEG